MSETVEGTGGDWLARAYEDNIRLQRENADLSRRLAEAGRENEKMRSALEPLARMAACAIRTRGDAEEGMSLLVPLKFLDAANVAVTTTPPPGSAAG